MKLVEWFKGKVVQFKERIKEPSSLKAKMLISVLILVIVGGGPDMTFPSRSYIPA